MHCQGECSFVSLRDIERAMIVMDWFHKFLPQIEKDYPPSDTVCYIVLNTCI